MNVDKSQLLLSCLLLGLVYPLNIVHEFGHAFVCALYNQNYNIVFSWLGRSYSSCLGYDFNRTFFGLAGGLLVMMCLTAILLIPYFRNNTGSRISLYALLITASVNSVVEGFFFEYYNENIITVQTILLGILLISFSVLWTSYLRQQKTH